MASSEALSRANTEFCLDLFKKLTEKNKTGNVFFSPFSISSALAMVMLGARGNTHTQMSEVLKFIEAEERGGEKRKRKQQQQQQQQQRRPFPTGHVCIHDKLCPKDKQLKDEVHDEFNKLLKALNEPDGQFTLCVANRLYGEKTYEFVEDFLKNSKKHYSAELESVDFMNSHEEARLNINTWVENQTQGKIKDLLVKDVVDNLTRMVLVNAIYFKGDWLKPFLEGETRDDKFRVNKNETKPVKMMHQNEKLCFNHDVLFRLKVLELPYKGREISLLILLPADMEDDSTGLEKLEKELTYDNFMNWTSPDSLSTYDVEVGLPRFKMEDTYDMKDVLVSMGMKDAFDVNLSDLSGMSPGQDLALSKVVHKAFVDVNEKGTEAAAATAAVMLLTCFLSPRGTFIADHPFLYFIRHNPSNSILFAGRYCSP
ncbi:leukocyte elastase inhibitor-like [Cynoglossus semilaevis]|uniref:leukocyte elastase inhibitor-like n=1 Tax=Cynoglossus semilaevis TaxID=244447 RepID=UPI000D62BD2C|nr:leukocyte elastase inhibitor-like [Cynoglossus semilaevis]XP_024910503.1 leukocyte elastase inhibitor-like [Cynoglossus semilaevis]